MSTKKSNRVTVGLSAIVAIYAAIVWPGCKSADDERPPAPTVAAPIPTTAASTVGSPGRENEETKMRRYEVSSSALALQAAARKEGEDALAAACTALDVARSQDCEAVQRAATQLKRAKDGLRSEVRQMLGDAISRTERAVAALCP